MSANCNTCLPETISENSLHRASNLCISSPTFQNDITQRRIWKQVRQTSSARLQQLSAVTSGAEFLKNNSNVNWHQRSDRFMASVQPQLHPTHGNSLKSTLTSGKPGSASPGGIGCDVKHDSYARYLNKIKAQKVGKQTTVVAQPLYGNKRFATGFALTCCVE
jgi:hypothetical protein